MPDDFAYRLEHAMRQVARNVGVASAYPPTPPGPTGRVTRTAAHH